MLRKMYSIRDTKTEFFNQPFFNHTHGEAERNFQQAMNDEKTTLSKHPEDYDLYYLGIYDDQTGHVKSLKTPEHMVKGVTAIAQEINRKRLSNPHVKQQHPD